MIDINMADHIASVFDAEFWDVMKHEHTHYWNKGGRGSTKSSFISLCIPILLLTNPNAHAVVLRKVGNTLRNSVYPQVQWALDTLGISTEFKSKVAPPEITYKKTGQKILFLGVDDPLKVKSIKVPFGYVGVVWYEELDQFYGMEEIRNLNQSLLRGGDKYWVFSSYNPPKSRDSWVNEEVLFDEPDRLVTHTNYTEVPPEWLGDQFLFEAEKLKAKNFLAYRHEYLGEVTGTGGTIFENVSDLAMDDWMVENFDHRYHGLDFGFALDPLAYVGMHYDAKKEDLYIFDEFYEQKVKNKRAFRVIQPRLHGQRVIADSAEPKSISDLKEWGMDIYGAVKGPDSVDYGIKWLQDRAHIYIDKRRCPNTYREFVGYEYLKDRNGKFISDYPDKNNHSIDATRYAMNDIIRANYDAEKYFTDFNV